MALFPGSDTTNGDFYNSAAGVVPTLWIAVGFATNTIAGVMRYLRSEALPSLEFKVTRKDRRHPAGKTGKSATFPFGTVTFGGQDRFKLRVSPDRDGGVFSWLFMLVLALSGVIAEGVVFATLGFGVLVPGGRIIILVSVGLLLVLTAMVLVVAVLASSNPPAATTGGHDAAPE